MKRQHSHRFRKPNQLAHDPTSGAVELHQCPRHVLLTGVSSDSHTWNLVYLELVLQSMGHRVTNLGALVADEEVIEACLRLRPDLLAVSSINGHGGQDGERLIRRMREHAQLAEMPAVIGGQLGVGGPAEHEALAARLIDAGFDAVFQPSALPLFQQFVNLRLADQDQSAA